MFWLSLVLFCVVLATLVLRMERKQETVLAALVGMVFSGMIAAVPIPNACLLTDTGPVSDPWALVLVSQVGIAPILAAWYAQDLMPGRPPPLGRTLAFVTMSGSLMMMALAAGRITCTLPSAPYLAICYCVAQYLAVWKTLNFVYACGSPDREGDRSVRVR